MSCKRSSRRGFTLVELLVVVAIIALLMAILLTSLRYVRSMGQGTRCLANVRQLGAGWHSYAGGHGNKMMNPQTLDSSDGWVMKGNTLEAIEGGLMYPYVSNPKAYRCPADKTIKNRSYSINHYANGGDDRYGECAVYLSQFKDHAQKVVFVEENDNRKGYNQGSWWIYTAEHNDESWLDYLANYHADGVNLYFMDGSASFHKFLDPETKNIHSFFASTPGNKDLAWFQKRVVPGRIVPD